jgi:hypothetical protein
MAEEGNRPFDDVDRAGDRVRGRVHRRMHSRVFCGGVPRPFFGVLLLALGALFLLDNLDIVRMRSVMRNFWPMMFIGWGLWRVSAGDTRRFLPWLAIGAGSVLLANRLFGFPLFLARMFWPLVLIAFGAHILYRAWRRPIAIHASGVAPGPESFGAAAPSPDVIEESLSTFNDSAMLGSVERRNASQTFRGGAATAFLGTVEVDLRECRMASSAAVVDVSAVMGSIELRIPRGWTVESRVSAVLGSFEDRTEAPVEVSANRLVVRGNAFLGGVEIRN